MLDENGTSHEHVHAHTKANNIEELHDNLLGQIITQFKQNEEQFKKEFEIKFQQLVNHHSETKEHILNEIKLNVQELKEHLRESKENEDSYCKSCLHSIMI